MVTAQCRYDGGTRRLPRDVSRFSKTYVSIIYLCLSILCLCVCESKNRCKSVYSITRQSWSRWEYLLLKSNARKLSRNLAGGQISAGLYLAKYYYCVCTIYVYLYMNAKMNAKIIKNKFLNLSFCENIVFEQPFHAKHIAFISNMFLIRPIDYNV